MLVPDGGKPFVKIFKEENNGTFTILTNCSDEREFYGYLAWPLMQALNDTRDDLDFTAASLFPLIGELICKIRGYKTEMVHQSSIFLAGFAWPDEHDIRHSWPRTPKKDERTLIEA